MQYDVYYILQQTDYNIIKYHTISDHIFACKRMYAHKYVCNVEMNTHTGTYVHIYITLTDIQICLSLPLSLPYTCVKMYVCVYM